MPSVSIRGLDELARRSDINFEELLAEIITRSAIRVEGTMKEYPSPPASGAWAAQTTRAQKAAFFSRLRRGEIDGQRTGTLGRRWTYEIKRGNGTVRGEVGNNTEYGPYVQSDAFQARFHRGRWGTDVQAIETEAGLIEEDANRVVARRLQAPP